MAAPIVYRCDDASAPALNGNAGSLITVLDACLINGYGAKSALGWTKSFTATNKAVYRAPSGIRHYLDVDDSGPDGTALGRNARVRGYEVMTAVGTGTGPYPTVAQASTPVIAKSSTADSTSRAWMLIGDDRTFYLLVAPAVGIPAVPSTTDWNGCLAAGEIYSNVTSDSYRGTLIWGTGTSTAVTNTLYLGYLTTSAAVTSVFQSIARSYAGTGAAVWASGAGHNLAGMPYPNGPDGGLYLNALMVAERASSSGAFSASTGFRGRFRGVLQHTAALALFNDGDTLSGTGDYAGRTFIAIRSSVYSLLFETTAWAFSS